MSSTSLIRRLGDRLAGVLVERRLGVEALHVADAADHEQPDDALRLRREVRLAGGRRPGGRVAGEAVAVEHRAEREAGEAHAEVGEERAARHAAAWC